MNNRITLFLQDKDLINELIKDPEVQLRIKDAVLCQIARRALRMEDLGDCVIQKAKEEIQNTFLEKSGYGWYSLQLKEDFKSLISEQAKLAFGDLVKDELTAMRVEIKHALEAKKQEIINELEACDPPAIIMKAAEKVVRQKLG